MDIERLAKLKRDLKSLVDRHRATADSAADDASEYARGSADAYENVLTALEMIELHDSDGSESSWTYDGKPKEN